jgi:hypothetical protein
VEWEWSKRILPALAVFHQVNGHCRVPRSFVVPSIGVWPKQTWGLKLGSVVSTIRRAGARSTHPWGLLIFPAWKVFYEEHGHARVPKLFVVPHEAPWPIEVHG